MMPLHGASVQAMYEAYNEQIPNQKIIDFSTNTNCIRLPQTIEEAWEALSQDIDCISQYPSVEYEELLDALALYHHLDKNHILITNGTNEGIYLLASYFQHRRIGIVEPTYPEYHRAMSAYDCQISHIQWTDIEEAKVDFDSFDAIILCNPNNPTGQYMAAEKLEALFAATQNKGVECVLDEAYIDFLSLSTEEIHQMTQSWIGHYPHLTILRSLTKIFRIPGIRLGYLMGSFERLSKMQKRQPSWSVNRLALILGKKLLNETKYLAYTKEYYQNERERVSQVLAEQKWEVLPSSTNFFLIKTNEADAIIRWCLQHGLVLRHTNNHYGLDGNYLRIGLQGPEENTLLTQVLEKYRRQ